MGGGQGHGTIGKAQTVEAHTGHGFPRRDVLLVIKPKAGVDHLNEMQILDDTRNDSEMVSAFHGDNVHVGTSPAWLRVVAIFRRG